MPCTRFELETREQSILAPYAQFSALTRGRRYREDPPEWRTHYQRDRDRVIHSRAFRRLEYKTQVFLNGTGDHLRTRLTHTMEVAAIARNISRALNLNEDLTETIALAHDLGHSPFGHKGEEALHALMKEHGGFEHNRQSLRIVELLEQKYPKFRGLNLTWEVREGLAKHETRFDPPGLREAIRDRSPSLEAQVANLADEITYYSHDLDDGLTARLLSEEQLSRDVKIWRITAQRVWRRFGKLPDESRRYYVIRCIIDDQVKDVVTQTESNLKAHRIQNVDGVRKQDSPLVTYSRRRTETNRELREYLYQNLYYNPEVFEPNRRAVRLLKELFEFYLNNPKELDTQVRRRIKKEGLPRAVCDYLAGMTDPYAMQEHRRLFGLKV